MNRLLWLSLLFVYVRVTEIPTEMAFNVDHLLNTNSTPSQEQRNNLQNFILHLDEAILNTDVADINKSKHASLNSSFYKLDELNPFNNGDIISVSCHKFVVYLSQNIRLCDSRPPETCVEPQCRLSIVEGCSTLYTGVVVNIRAWPSFEKTQHGQAYWLMDRASPLLPFIIGL